MCVVVVHPRLQAGLSVSVSFCLSNISSSLQLHSSQWLAPMSRWEEQYCSSEDPKVWVFCRRIWQETRFFSESCLPTTRWHSLSSALAIIKIMFCLLVSPSLLGIVWMSLSYCASDCGGFKCTSIHRQNNYSPWQLLYRSYRVYFSVCVCVFAKMTQQLPRVFTTPTHNHSSGVIHFLPEACGDLTLQQSYCGRSSELLRSADTDGGVSVKSFDGDCSWVCKICLFDLFTFKSVVLITLGNVGVQTVAFQASNIFFIKHKHLISQEKVQRKLLYNVWCMETPYLFLYWTVNIYEETHLH